MIIFIASNLNGERGLCTMHSEPIQRTTTHWLLLLLLLLLLNGKIALKTDDESQLDGEDRERESNIHKH